MRDKLYPKTRLATWLKQKKKLKQKTKTNVQLKMILKMYA